MDKLQGLAKSIKTKKRDLERLQSEYDRLCEQQLKEFNWQKAIAYHK